MARLGARVFPLVSRYSPIHTSPAISSSLGWRPADFPTSSSALSSGEQLLNFLFGALRRGFHVSSSYSRHPGPFSSVFAALRGFRKPRRRQAAMKQVPEEKKLELRVKISVEEGMPEDHEVVNVVEMLKLNAPMAMKMTFDGIKELDFRVQDSSIDNIGGHEKIGLSILLCNDIFISKLHKEWRGVDCPIDVLCRFQQEILGDIVISAEAAARQAKERGHSLLDEVRILMVQGLLHLVGFDQGSGYRARVEMGKLEDFVLRSLGWKARGHARDIDHVATSGFRSKDIDDKIINPRERLQDLRFYRPKFSYIFCDMDGTLLNSQSQVSITTAEALREVLARGVKIIIATGKTRPAVISALKMVGLAGKNGVASEVSPGIFLQGLLVYGRNGREIHRRSLDQNVCREALFYSLEHEVPLVAFCQDRCLTLFDHPLVDSLHTIYHEPKAEVIPSVEHLLAAADIQKLIFLDTADGVSFVLRPYWEEATDGRAGVVQAQPDMLEIIPAGTSKGEGVRVLLHHLGISPKEIMAIGDGENDVEMLKLASLGVALGNGSEKAKAVADVIGATNDEDGVAMAIYRYAF